MPRLREARGTRSAKLIAGISFLDALLVAGHGQARIALLALAGVALTRVLQRHVPGT